MPLSRNIGMHVNKLVKIVDEMEVSCFKARQT